MDAADGSAGAVVAGTWFDRPPPPRIATPSVVHRLADDEEEEAMPKGQYDRSKAKPRVKADESVAAAEPMDGPMKPEKKPRRRKAKVKARKARAVGQRTAAALSARNVKASIAAQGPRFGVFEDGSVQIATADCTGRLSGEDAAALVAFIGRLKGK